MVSIKMEDYSENSFVLQGDDTKKYKDKIKELGGKWNSNLKIGPGWIFNIKNKQEVKDWVKSFGNNSLEIKQSVISTTKQDKVEDKLENNIENMVDDFAFFIMDKIEDVNYKKLLHYIYFLE